MEPESARNIRTCPLNGEICCDGVRKDFKPDEKGLIKSCRLWTHVAGKDPQSEKVIDHFDCAFAWMPVVGLEQSQMVRQNTATLQEFRAETHEGLQAFSGAMKKAAIALNHVWESQKELIEGVQLPDELDHKNGHENAN